VQYKNSLQVAPQIEMPPFSGRPVEFSGKWAFAGQSTHFGCKSTGLSAASRIWVQADD
jgi:hypothetical protein